jgi:hypothetical protein
MVYTLPSDEASFEARLTRKVFDKNWGFIEPFDRHSNESVQEK